MGALCLVACLLIRAVATFLVAFGCGLNAKEKLFISLTWTAKATVQVPSIPTHFEQVVNNSKREF